MAALHTLASQIKVEAETAWIGRTAVQVPVIRLDGPKDIGKRLVADQATLPGNLSRLIPARWGNAKPAEWEGFVRLAIAMGKL